MIFAGLAMIACAMIVAPVEASVPIDPGIYAPPSPHDEYSASVPIHIDKTAFTCRSETRAAYGMRTKSLSLDRSDTERACAAVEFPCRRLGIVRSP